MITFLRKLFSRELSLEDQWQKEAVGHRNAIRGLLAKWSEQKLFDVLAFCEDGKMVFDNPCSCLRGVATSGILHTSGESPAHILGHYHDCGDPQVLAAETAYRNLGYTSAPELERRKAVISDLWRQRISYYFHPEPEAQRRRDQELIALLREEIARREVQRAIPQRGETPVRHETEKVETFG